MENSNEKGEEEFTIRNAFVQSQQMFTFINHGKAGSTNRKIVLTC